jgi:branched-chain amino acid transport system ATP-binding protein
MTALLEVQELHTHIGQFHILQGVNLAVPEGGVTVLLGRNGAGKTSTLKTVMGLLAPSRGVIRFDGQPVGGRPPHLVARLGVGYVPEDRGVFTDLTVEENLLLAVRTGGLKEKLGRIFALFPDLERLFDRKGGTLSGGQQQMLAIARAMVGEPRLILLDEPSKGLAPLLVRQVGEALNELKGTTTMLLVEQNFALATAVGDRCFIMDDGTTVWDGTMADVAQNRELQVRYLGLGVGAAPGAGSPAAPAVPAAPTAPAAPGAPNAPAAPAAPAAPGAPNAPAAPAAPGAPEGGAA